MSGYRNCPWCRGAGFVSCDVYEERDYKAAFPDGPVPLVTFNTDDPADVELAKRTRTIGAEALEKAFSKGLAEGLSEIISNCEAAKREQEARKKGEK